jgi:hypothetical protein
MGEFLQSTVGRGSGRLIESECQLKDLQHVERTENTTRVQAECRCNCLDSVSRTKPQEVSSNLLKVILYFGPWIIQSVYLLDSRFTVFTIFRTYTVAKCRSQCPCGLNCSSSAARLLRSWVRIPLGHGCLSVVSVVCCQVEVSATD